MAASSLMWQVEYARFMAYPPLGCVHSTHSNLTVHSAFHRRRSSGGAWLKSSGATAIVKLIAAGSDNAVLVLSIEHKTLEEHFISKLNFIWPQMSCVSQQPGKGSRAVFASYKDSAGQIQNFAMRFLNGSESQSFVNSLKESLKYVTTVGNTTSQFQSLNGINTANEALYPSNDFENHVHPTDDCDPLAQTLLDVPVNYESQEAMLPNDRPESQTVAYERDLQSHPAKYMTGPSFNAMLSKLESFMSDMGGDLALQLP